jgi:N12 class adenine-specific DNA methylase
MARFRKTILTVGRYRARNGRWLDANPERLQRWSDAFAQLRQRGVKIPLSWGHQPFAQPDDPNSDPDDPTVKARREYHASAYNAGHLDALHFDPATGQLDAEGDAPGLEVDEAGNLLAWVKMPDGTQRRTAVNEVSVGINDWTDATGHLWRDVPIHLAICTLPVMEKQDGFKALATSAGEPLYFSLAMECEPIDEAAQARLRLLELAVSSWVPTKASAAAYPKSYVGGAGSWVRYFGPQGGRGWKSTLTGKIAYQESMPGAHEHGPAAAAEPKLFPAPEDEAKKRLDLLEKGKEFPTKQADAIKDEAGKRLTLREPAVPVIKPKTSADAAAERLKLRMKGKADDLERDGGSGGKGGLPAGELVGAPVAAKPEAKPAGTGEGVGAEPAIPPPSGGARRDGAGKPAGGPGDGPAHGEGTGDAPAAGNGAIRESLAAPPTPENPTDVSAGNWHYQTRDFFARGLKAKYQDNLAALRTLAAIKAEGRQAATAEEQESLSKFVGWGQFPALFNDYQIAEQRRHAGLVEVPREEVGKWEDEREELRGLLTDEEWAAARASTMNGHYTHPDIVDAHWKMAQRLGFNGGQFLETSAGVGYYLGMMPPDLAGSTKSSAVELDQGTGRILQLLYPKAHTEVNGFQDHRAPDNFYDLVASNVPFGSHGVHDPRYNKHRAKIHDYFFLKSADLVKPGGLVMHITSPWTLDKGNARIREELAKTCDLVSAVRMPGDTHAENAGTSVVTDMLILRKRGPGEAPGDQSWLETTEVPDPDGGAAIPINKYFALHPEQVLGRLDRSGTMRAAGMMNVSLATPEELSEKLGKEVKVAVTAGNKRRFEYADGAPVAPEDIRRVGKELFKERMAKAIERLPQGVFKRDVAPAERFTPEALPAPGHVLDGGYHVENGKLYVREGGGMVETKTNAKAFARIQGQMGLRDAMRAVINAETQGNDPTEARAALNKAYDGFVSEHGVLHERANQLAFRSDPDFATVLALEKWNGQTKTADKAAMFSKITVGHVAAVQKTDNVHEGLGVSLHENGRVDVEHIARLTGRDKEAVGKELVDNGLAYESPGEGWKPADQYLSGNVRRKLVLARAAAAADPKYAPNAAALEKVQPDDLAYHEIEVKMGAPWVPASDMAEFAAHLTERDASDFEIGHVETTGEWKMQRSHSRSELWQTSRADFDDLFSAAMNGSHVVIYDKGDGDTKVVNREATLDAQAKVSEMRDKFKEWLWSDDERQARLHRHYNDNFNNIKQIQYDGSHLTFPGMNPSIKLHPHIPNFVWQVITTGKGLAGHEVGTGKTYAMIASAMELRRLGLARKPAIACLKANIDQIEADAHLLYPGAKILSTADMFDAKKRQKTLARIATGDYDLILLTHDHLDKLAMKPEVQAKYIKEEIAELLGAHAAAKESGNQTLTKQYEKMAADMEAKLEGVMAGGQKDKGVSFEDTGIDHLFVDEAHKYKSLPCYSKKGQIKGVPTTRSQRATNMQMRTRYLLGKNGDRGVVFATGTPITNTMAELYNMQRYLQPNELKDRGISSFDDWANTFGDEVTKMEFTVSGQYKPVTRFSRFVNTAELKQIAGQMLDVQRADEIKNSDGGPVIIRPTRHDSAVVSPKTPEMEALMKTLQKRAEAVKEMSRSDRTRKGADNMLAICTDGRKGAVDMRLLNPEAADDPSSKTNRCVRNVLDIWKKNPGKSQTIFSDLGVHDIGKSRRAGVKSAEAEDDVEVGADDPDPDKAAIENLRAGSGKFNLYEDIIGKLVKGGIPREKIADFSQLQGPARVEAQAAMRRGEVVVAIGGTQKLGTGTNVQDKIIAMHHLDVPWLPADNEQRDGRGWRHGNENKDIGVHRYVAEGSLDQTFWQILGRKSAFIKQMLSGKADRIMKEEDSEEITPEQFMAIASGNPLVLEKVNLDEDVKNLRLSESRHYREQEQLGRSVKRLEGKIKESASSGQMAVDLLGHLAKHPYSLTVGGKTFDKQDKDAVEAFDVAWQEAVKRHDAIPEWKPERENIVFAKYRGMNVILARGQLRLDVPGVGFVTSGRSIKSMEYIANKKLPETVEELKADARKATLELGKVREQIGKPFPKAAELQAKRARSEEVEAELAKSSKEPGEVGEPTPEAGRLGVREQGRQAEQKPSAEASPARPAAPLGGGTGPGGASFGDAIEAEHQGEVIDADEARRRETARLELRAKAAKMAEVDGVQNLAGANRMTQTVGGVRYWFHVKPHYSSAPGTTGKRWSADGGQTWQSHAHNAIRAAKKPPVKVGGGGQQLARAPTRSSLEIMVSLGRI